MKKRLTRICAGVLLTLLAAVLALRPVTTSAYGVFSGVETVVMDKVAAGESYHVLEIVPDGASGEMGYLAGGSEPVYFQDRLEEYLELHRDDFVNTGENRAAYINGLIEELTGAGLCGADAPLSAEEYGEEYFPTEEQRAGMQRLDFPEGMYETLEISGAYVRNAQDEGSYSANVSSFRYNEGGDYAVEFESTVPVSDSAPYDQPYEYKTANGGYYEAVENPMEGRTYYYITYFAYVGEASASGSYLADLDPADPYSYTASGDGGFDFVPGEVSAEHPENALYQVETGHVWYEGGITNNNWFKDKILSASGEETLDIRVQTVTESELVTADLSGIDMIYISGEGLDQGLSYGRTSAEGYLRVKMLYSLIGDRVPCLIDSAALDNCMESYDSSDVAKLAVWALQREALPADELDGADGSLLTRPEQLNENYNGTATDYAEENIYCMATLDDSGVREPFFTGLTDYFPETGEDGFQAVRALIAQENTLRVPEEYLDTRLTKAGVLQYIINYQNERVFDDKTVLRVLDVEPAMGDLYLQADTSDDRILTTAKLAEWTGVPRENITIVRMTSAEFIGKIEDMNTEYDMVYFGLGYAATGGGSGSNAGDYMNRDSSGNTVYNDSLMDGLVYTHTGDAYIRSAILGGQLDTDYVSNDPSNYLYGPLSSGLEGSQDAYGYRTQWSSALSKLITTPQTISGFQYNNPNNDGERSTRTVSVGNVGVFRTSGNDITETKKKELEEFVGARYPVVFAEGFLDAEGNVNSGVIDNSSVLYAFAQENMDAENVFFLNEDGEPEDEVSFRYYMNMPKLELHFFNPATGAEEEETELSTGELRTTDNNYGNKIVQIVDDGSGSGVYTMRYQFRVDSQVDASSRTQYRAMLYLDMNADGKFVSNDSYTEAQSDCLILDENGNEVSRDADGSYILSSGNTYTLEKDIPSQYWGMLTWKLEISQMSNPYIRTSKVGYTIVSRPAGNTEVQVIKVLQIRGNNPNWGGDWNLQTDSDMQRYFNNLESTEGVRFQVTSIQMRQFDGVYTSFDSLKDYQMLIFGFQDSYTDITDDRTLEAVDDFINSGRSVLFTHDCSSFVNVATEKQYSYDTATDYDVKWLCFRNNQGSSLERHWGYHVNQMFRDILGMDRYGITYNERTSRTPEVSLFRSTLLKEGQLLDITEETLEDGSVVTVGTIDTENGGITTRLDPAGSGEPLTSAVLGDDKDIAYVPGSNRTQAYGETQGYTYGAINFHYYAGTTTSRYSLNKYMNWRTMPLSQSRNDESLGALGTMYATQVNDGQITHYPYEIGNGTGKGIRIAKTHYQYYQLNMDEDIDMDGGSDIVVWYCLGADGSSSMVYNSSPNDVRNNYYIYSIGNVTYSGVGHSTVSNTDEKKLFLNTIVAAYKTSIKDPSIRFLQNGSRTSAEAEALYVHQDNAVGSKSLEEEVSFYYTVSEPNLVTSDKTIYVDYRLPDGTRLPAADPGDGSAYITTEAVDGGALELMTDGSIRGIRSGSVYKATLHNLDDPDVQSMLASNTMGITVHTASAFDYYGETYGLNEGDREAPEAERTLDMVRLTLFDLD